MTVAKNMDDRIFHTATALCFSALLALACDAAVTGASAGSATSWTEQNHATTRLVSDTAQWQGRKVLMAGVHIKLDAGWKTYWRNPGDSGLPPRFDWSGSKNLKSARLLWPAPVRYRDSAGTSFGYKKEVVFPVVIEPEKPDQPVDLNLKMEFAVCADICIPAEAELKLRAGDGGFFSRSHTDLLRRYLDRVPTRQKSGSGSGPSVNRAKAQLEGPAPHLTVDASFPGGGEGADLFVEGPEGFYLAPAELAGRQQDGTVRFKIDLTKGDDPGTLRGQTVTLTLVSDSAQAETTWRIE